MMGTRLQLIVNGTPRGEVEVGDAQKTAMYLTLCRILGSHVPPLPIKGHSKASQRIKGTSHAMLPVVAHPWRTRRLRDTL